MLERNTPAIVLLCHDDDPIDREGLARWLACTFRLVGIVVLEDTLSRRWRALRRERRRSGWLGALDAIAFRVWYRLTQAAHDRAWTAEAVRRLAATYPAAIDDVPRIVTTSPNSEEARRFLTALAPDLVIARCKHLLKPDVFEIPRAGTVVLHPGICPEYRNAHGCFWALAQRDLARVGMTLLRVDRGVDTGDVFLHAACEFDERVDSHHVIQQRVVIDNLPAIGRTLRALALGTAAPIDTRGRASAAWGQPRLSAYLRWRRAARRTPDATRAAAI